MGQILIIPSAGPPVTITQGGDPALFQEGKHAN